MTPLRRAFEKFAPIFNYDLTWAPAGYYEDERTLYAFAMFEAGTVHARNEIASGDLARSQSLSALGRSSPNSGADASVSAPIFSGGEC